MVIRLKRKLALRQKITKTLVVFTSIIIAFALCEAGLWFLKVEYPIFFDYDKQLGIKLRPGVRGYWLEEGGGYVSINSDGLRDREHSLNSPPNTLRIAVLGDSYTQAFEVDQEEAFLTVMERNLKGCTQLKGRQVETINFGQSGLGTTQELLVLRHRVWKYSPDVVLLAFYTDNDVAENSKELSSQWPYSEYFPHYSYNNRELQLDDRKAKEMWLEAQNSWWHSFQQRLNDNLRIYQVMRQSKKYLWEWWWQQQQKLQESTTSNHHYEIYLKPTSRAWQEAWKITKAALLQMRNEVAARGARFFVVVLTNPAQVNPDPSIRAELTKKLGIKDLFYPDRHLEKFCQQEGIPILLLAPALQAYATEHKVFLHGFKGNLGGGHWNQAGHRLAGTMLAAWLCGQLN